MISVLHNDNSIACVTGAREQSWRTLFSTTTTTVTELVPPLYSCRNSLAETFYIALLNVIIEIPYQGEPGKKPVFTLIIVSLFYSVSQLVSLFYDQKLGLL